MTLQDIRSRFFQALPADLTEIKTGPHRTVHLGQCIGSAISMTIAGLAARKQPILVVTPDPELATFIHSDLLTLGLSSCQYFPPSGKQPFDSGMVQDTTVTAQRSVVIDHIRRADTPLVVSSAEALFEKTASSQQFSAGTMVLSRGMTLNPDHLSEKLVDQRYQAVSFVNEPGEFSRRGGIMDIFPFSGAYPVRLEFFGNEMDTIREFDPDSQRSVAYLDEFRLVPNLESISGEHRVSLFSFFPENTLYALIDLPGTLSQLKQLFDQAMQARQESPPEKFLSPVEFREVILSGSRLLFGNIPSGESVEVDLSLQSRPQPQFNSSIPLLRANLRDMSLKGIETWILCDNEGQRKRFEELLGEPGPELRFHLEIQSLHRGFILPEEGLAVYTDHQIFNRYHRPASRTRVRRGGISFKELKDLNVGDYVVHVDHGIGKFAGFRKITVRGAEQESVMLRYQDDSILYVNVSSLYKLQKFSGKDGTPPKITRLGSGEWARKKARTHKRVKDIARDLIALYARRKSQKAFAFSPDNAMQTELEASFMFVETPDQAQVIADVKFDMEQQTPMDRLVCGDVGFGKTEVAVRAAFKAVLDGKQVAVMVPTTILADQHWKTFASRMKSFAVNIEVLSRFRSKARQEEILRRTLKGEIDILIGTHRLASKDVRFRDLGLLIIDEEQRFGVSMKERLKEFRATVDVLTLTATPIPRTLQFSLMGARDLSVINTPPQNRQPVQTEIHSFDPRLIRDAIIHEISRGGQVFFIHNRIQNIEEIAETVRTLAPNIRIQFAHGQMPGSRLEKIILDFYNHKFDVLVSTNIVENGIDISNANTIIINHANRFGLSELHQLRGRVGRSNRKAYCYLVTPPMESLTLEARRRLMALEEYSDLGSGFHIAMRDLDIRGAGDILGAEQSGFISDIGLEMYTRILNEAVRELKETEFAELFATGELLPERPETSVEFDESALLPDYYVSDSVERLNLYRRLSSASGIQELNEWRDEVTDRFGPLPDAARHLITAAHIKNMASSLWLEKVVIRSGRMWLQCPDHTSESGMRFYDQGVLQHLMNRLNELNGQPFQLIQNKEAIRFAVGNIPDLESAAGLLSKLLLRPDTAANETGTNGKEKTLPKQAITEKHSQTAGDLCKP